MKDEKQTARVKTFSAQDFAALGMQHIAYVRQAVLDGQTYWSVHAADGAEIGRMPDREVAFAACRQNDLEPLSVH
ncbi:MAG: DUF1150 family protein [Rhodospirillales bacterium]